MQQGVFGWLKSGPFKDDCDSVTFRKMHVFPFLPRGGSYRQKVVVVVNRERFPMFPLVLLS